MIKEFFASYLGKVAAFITISLIVLGGIVWWNNHAEKAKIKEEARKVSIPANIDTANAVADTISEVTEHKGAAVQRYTDYTTTLRTKHPQKITPEVQGVINRADPIIKDAAKLDTLHQKEVRNLREAIDSLRNPHVNRFGASGSILYDVYGKRPVARLSGTLRAAEWLSGVIEGEMAVAGQYEAAQRQKMGLAPVETRLNVGISVKFR